MNSSNINYQYAMILANSSYRIFSLNPDNNNYRVSDIIYDNISNPLSVSTNDINFTHLNNVYINSTQEATNISPITISQNSNNEDNSTLNPNLISINNISNSINRTQSTDDLFNLINNWINSISPNNNNNIHVNYLQEPEPVKINMSVEEFIKMIKDVNYSNELENKQCSICTLNFEIDDCIKSTPCNHLFHKDCIYQWLTKHCIHPLCPVCRHDCREQIIKKKKKKRCVIC